MTEFGLWRLSNRALALLSQIVFELIGVSARFSLLLLALAVVSEVSLQVFVALLLTKAIQENTEFLLAK